MQTGSRRIQRWEYTNRKTRITNGKKEFFFNGFQVKKLSLIRQKERHKSGKTSQDCDGLFWKAWPPDISFLLWHSFFKRLLFQIQCLICGLYRKLWWCQLGSLFNGLHIYFSILCVLFIQWHLFMCNIFYNSMCNKCKCKTDLLKAIETSLYATEHIISFCGLMCTYWVGIFSVSSQHKLVCLVLQLCWLFFRDSHDTCRWKSDSCKCLGVSVTLYILSMMKNVYNDLILCSIKMRVKFILRWEIEINIFPFCIQKLRHSVIFHSEKD